MLKIVTAISKVRDYVFPFILCIAFTPLIHNYFSTEVYSYHLEGDSLNILGAVMADDIKGYSSKSNGYRYDSAIGFYKLLLLLKSMKIEDLARFLYYLNILVTVIFTLTFLFSISRYYKLSLSCCFIGLFLFQEPFATMLYPNDMNFALLFFCFGFLIISLNRSSKGFAAAFVLLSISSLFRPEMVFFFIFFIVMLNLEREDKRIRTILTRSVGFLLFFLMTSIFAQATIGGSFIESFARGGDHVKMILFNKALSSWRMDIYHTHLSLTNVFSFVFSLIGLLIAIDRKELRFIPPFTMCLICYIIVYPYATTPKYLLPFVLMSSVFSSYSINEIRKHRWFLWVPIAALTIVLYTPGTYFNEKLTRKIQLSSIGIYVLPYKVNTHDLARLTSGYTLLPNIFSDHSKWTRMKEKAVKNRLAKSNEIKLSGLDWLERGFTLYHARTYGFSYFKDSVFYKHEPKPQVPLLLLLTEESNL